MKSLVGGGWVGGGCYWYVKVPQCKYMEHGLEYITFYVKKYMASLQVCCGLPLVRDKQLGAPAFVKLGYYTEFSFVGWEVTSHQTITRTDDEFFHRAFYKLSATFGKTFFGKHISLFLLWYVAELLNV